MASRPRRLPYERYLRELETAYASAQRTLVARIEAALRSGDLETRQRAQAQLAAAVAAIDQLGAEVLPIAREMVGEAYRNGSDQALAQIRRISVDLADLPGSFAGVSVEAVAELQAALLDRLDDANRTVGRQVADVYRREQLRAALRATLGANGSPQTAAVDLQARLARDRAVRRLIQDGGTGFIDRAGRRWQLDTYARMAARTVTREAVVYGSMARMAAHGISLARVSSHAGSCDICKPMEGRLISLDGSISSFEGEAVFTTSRIPPFHPNCAHSLAPFVPDVEALVRQMRQAVA